MITHELCTKAEAKENNDDAEKQKEKKEKKEKMINLTERDNARGWYPSFRRMFPASIKNNKLRRREVSLPLIMIDSD